MKTSKWQTILVVAAAAGLAITSTTALAQTAADTNTPAVNAPAPPAQPQVQLAYGVPQILQLTQAKIGDQTIAAYIKNSGISYNLDANQIIYLRQQGVSDAVITLMLNQPRAGVSSAPAPVPYTQPPAYTPPADTAASAPPATAAPATTTAPSVTYVQTVPTTTYYYSSPYYYYPSYGYYGYPYGYGYYAPVSLSFGWGWGWGGGWRGGWGGGWHGGGWHGGGGFHGGGHR